MSRGGRGIVGGGIGMIILVVVGMFFGIDPRVILGLAGTVQTVQQQVAPQKVEGTKGPLSDDMGRFVAGVLADTEETWGTLFQQLGRQYQNPTLVLFTGARRPRAGPARRRWARSTARSTRRSTSTSPSTSDLRDRFKAPGDFAQAYVIAHEIGHHVQNQLGIMPKDATRLGSE